MTTMMRNKEQITTECGFALATAYHADPDTERSVLGEMVISPTIIANAPLTKGDFTDSRNRTIFSEILKMFRGGMRVGTAELLDRLRVLGLSERAGGEDYVLDLTSGVQTGNPAYARLITLSMRRRQSEQIQRLAEADRVGGPLAAPLNALIKLRADLEAHEMPSGVRVPAYPLLCEAVPRFLAPFGNRMGTGFPTLDRATRGGIPSGTVVTLAGAPGAGKSGLATCVAVDYEQAGWAVVYYAADEPPRGIITRIGQMYGHAREQLEADDDAGAAVRIRFAREVANRSLVVIDPDAENSCATIEDAALVLEHVAVGRPRVLIVDSLQTCRCAAAAGIETLRERTDAKMDILKALAKSGVLVVVISEMARSGYRTGDRNADISALAAGKESGSIEYGSSLLVGLRPVKGRPGLVDVEIAKNRLGADRPDFRLELDPERARYREVVPDPAEQALSSEEVRAVAARQRVIAAVNKRPGHYSSMNALSRDARGTRADNLVAIRELADEGALVKVAGKYCCAAEAARAA